MEQTINTQKENTIKYMVKYIDIINKMTKKLHVIENELNISLTKQQTQQIYETQETTMSLYNVKIIKRVIDKIHGSILYTNVLIVMVDNSESFEKIESINKRYLNEHERIMKYIYAEFKLCVGLIISM